MFLITKPGDVCEEQCMKVVEKWAKKLFPLEQRKEEYNEVFEEFLKIIAEVCYEV